MNSKKNIKFLFENCCLISKNIDKSFSKEGKIDEDVLKVLKISFEDIISFIKKNLIQVTDSFYGNLLISMNTEINFKQKGMIDIDVKKDPLVMLFNPLYCFKYSYQELLGCIINELLKIVFLHPESFADLNSEKDLFKHEILEKSSSASVSTMLQNDIRLENNLKGVILPNDAYTVSSLFQETNIRVGERKPLEYYYKILSAFPPKNAPLNSSSCKSYGMSSEGEKIEKISTPNNESEGDNIHNWEDSDSEDTKQKIKGLVSDSLNAVSESGRGLMPNFLLEQIKKLLQPPEIDWKNYFKKLVGNFPVPHRSTKLRLNRRQPERFDLSGRLPKRLVEIVIGIDTSGSMSNDIISYCMNEIFNIVKNYQTKITIIECDMEINKVYQVKKLSDVQTKVAGRGGTSFIPVIEFINGDKKYLGSKKFKNSGKFKNAIMIYFTDGFGDYQIPKPKTYKNLWVVMKDERNLSLKNPYGNVKSLMKDKKFKKQML